jgi:tetratricopeptide (TPR) repeat protein
VILRKLQLAILVIAALSIATLARNDDQPGSNPKREHAVELFTQGKMVDAMPLLEELASENPKDAGVFELWGASVLGYADTLSDPELRKKSRVRARSILLRAQALGDNSDLLATLLRNLPEDGSFSAYSENKDVDAAMQQAEADFARGDLEKARQGYLRAHLLDPNNYYAPLFIGDSYFKEHQPAYAGQWFAEAVRIDANKETAYRYWGDALLSAGKVDDARTKYIEAIVADPYNQSSWNGLRNWLKRSKVNLTWINLKDGVAVEVKDGKTNISLDSSLPKDDPLVGGWLAYGMSRALWMSQKFAKEYPKEPSYRHSLKEETESLHMLIAVSTEVAAKKKTSPDGPLATLAQIEKAGLLDPFVLLNRADAGIAQDYSRYRESNRDKISRYLNEFVVPRTPPEAQQAGK